MLHVWMGYYGEAGVTVRKPDDYFIENFEFDNLSTDFSKRVIKDCGNAETIAPGLFLNPIFGRHGMAELASGVKTVLLAKYNKEVVTSMVYCGNNCIPYIIEASVDEDVTVATERYIYWYESGLVDDTDKIHIMNDDSYVKNSWEYFCKWGDFMHDRIIV